jgi:hypothetical protein
MASPLFGSNAFVRCGTPLSAVIRNTTDISIERASGAKATPTTTGEVGFSSGVRMASLSFTTAQTNGSVQQKTLTQLYEAQTPADWEVVDGNIRHQCRGVIESISVSSKVNEVIEYAVKIAAADGTAQ